MRTKHKATDFNVSAELLEHLATTMSKADLTEIEFVDGERKIRLARTPAPVAAPALSMPVASPLPVAAASPTPTPTSQTLAPIAAPGEQPAQGGTAVKSPMVGTAYLSPEPGKPAFIKIGDKVNKGQTLMIIEAMKVMNPLPAPSAGIIQSILVNDASPVEFDQIVVVLD